MGHLTAARVKALSTPGLHGDGGTLYLRVAPGGSRSWIQRLTINSKRRDVGLDGWPLVTLAEAREPGAFTVTDADPRRLGGSFLIRKEDTAKLPNMEPSLRENLSMVLSDELDKQIVNRNGTAPNLNGILAQLTDPSAPDTDDGLVLDRVR